MNVFNVIVNKFLSWVHVYDPRIGSDWDTKDLTYDANDNLITEVYSLGGKAVRTWTYTYNAGNLPTKEVRT